MLTVGVDVGGTFTDIFLQNTETGAWLAHKVPSTPPDFMTGFLHGVQEAVKIADEGSFENLQYVIHGTTVATNSILTKSGARLGFLLTEGCSDILYVGVGWRPKMYDLDMDPVEPLFLAPRRRTKAVRERLDYKGQVITPLDEEQLREAAKSLVEDHKIEVFVVCYIHSYANSLHETRTRDILKEIYPNIPVTISSDVLPRKREYRRLVVSGFDAYVKPGVSNYIQSLADKLTDEGFRGPLHIMQSNGGVAGIQSIIERPVRTILSGLAAGVIGAAHVGKMAGHPNCISLDMGGTSADVALIKNGRPTLTNEGTFEDYPLHIPMIDVRTIGAGGSSIAYIDEGGGLRVGPRSAGAAPGPACYSRGGVEPTVTDASFVLGYLNPKSFAGDIALDIDKSHQAIKTYIADPLGITVPEAALGIHRIVNSNMAQTLRLVSVKRGYDPREFTFIPCGGAGCVHAGRLAEDVGMRKMLIPLAPGVLSAMGLMLAPLQHEASASFEKAASITDVSQIAGIFSRLDLDCEQRMVRDGVAAGEQTIEYYMEMRYIGQSYNLEIRIDTLLDEASLAKAVSTFHDAHKRTYGHSSLERDVELVSLRAQHRKDAVASTLGLLVPGHEQVVKESVYRSAYFSKEEGYRDVPVYDRTDLGVGTKLIGPAIIEQSDTTLVLYAGHKAVVDEQANIIITL